MPAPYSMRNRVLLALGYRNYKEYLCSGLWKGIRTKVLCIYPTCVVCARRVATQVHHTSYSRATLEGRNLRALYGVCHACHERIEFTGGSKLTAMQALLKFRQLMSIRKIPGPRFTPKKFSRRKRRR